ncbi:hypothetical protein AZH51_02320 [Branchiibius sp. NY16-3462-2]|nr:hypothetical protein AZH51_02320 [Branchiibius sp. NY16-3462-2]
MALRSDWSDDVCPVARAIDAIGDPWTLLVLREALAGARRFEQFKRRLTAADNVLAARLSRMVEQGLLEARPYSAGGRPRHEYVPTRAAEDAVPILQAYAAWGHAHRPSESENPRFETICGKCGSTSQRAEVCEFCGELLSVENGVVWQRPGGWDGRRVQLTGAES